MLNPHTLVPFTRLALLVGLLFALTAGLMVGLETTHATAPQRSGDLKPLPQYGNVDTMEAGWHGALAWHQQGYQGSGVNIGVIDTEFQGISVLFGNELPHENQVPSYCFPSGSAVPVEDHAYSCNFGDGVDCNDDHGSRTAQVVMDMAPQATLHISNPKGSGGFMRAVH